MIPFLFVSFNCSCFLFEFEYFKFSISNFYSFQILDTVLNVSNNLIKPVGVHAAGSYNYEKFVTLCWYALIVSLIKYKRNTTEWRRKTCSYKAQ